MNLLYGTRENKKNPRLVSLKSLYFLIKSKRVLYAKRCLHLNEKKIKYNRVLQCGKAIECYVNTRKSENRFRSSWYTMDNFNISKSWHSAQEFQLQAKTVTEITFKYFPNGTHSCYVHIRH